MLQPRDPRAWNKIAQDLQVPVYSDGRSGGLAITPKTLKHTKSIKNLVWIALGAQVVDDSKGVRLCLEFL